MVVYATTKPEWNYWHIRLIHPKHFYSNTFRSHDVGRKGHAIRIAGRLKKTFRYATQAWRIAKTDVKITQSHIEGKTLHGLDKQTQSILQSIRSNYGRIKIIEKR